MAAWQSVHLTDKALDDLILETLEVASYIDLGETGRSYVSKAFGEEHTVTERAEFSTHELVEYAGDAIELDDDTLDELCRDAIITYVRQHKDEYRAKIMETAEAFKKEMLAGPAGG